MNAVEDTDGSVASRFGLSANRIWNTGGWSHVGALVRVTVHRPGRCPLCDRPYYQGAGRCICGAVLSGQNEESPPSRIDYGALLACVPMVGFFLILFWILPLPALAFPGGKLFKLTLVVIIASALFTLLDAERLRRLQWRSIPTRLDSLGPAGWFLFTLLAWPVAVSAYLYINYFQSRRLLARVGWISLGLFGVAFLICGISISQEREKVWGAPSTGTTRITAKPSPLATTPETIVLLPPPGPLPGATVSVYSTSASVLASITTGSVVSTTTVSAAAPIPQPSLPTPASGGHVAPPPRPTPRRASYGIDALDGDAR